MESERRYSPEKASKEAGRLVELVQKGTVENYREAELVADEIVKSPEEAKIFHSNEGIIDHDRALLESLKQAEFKSIPLLDLERQVTEDMALRIEQNAKIEADRYER